MSGGGFSPSPSPTASATPTPPISQTVTLTGATIPAGATSAQVRLYNAAGQVIATVPATINANGSVTFTIPAGLTGFTGAQVLYFNASGALIGTQATVPLVPGQTTAALSGGVSPSNLVTVTVSAGSASTNLTVGQTLPLVVAGTYTSGGTNVTTNVTGATFTSTNNSVANVSSTGVVTAIGAGNASIAATLPNPSGGNVSGAISVSVTNGTAPSPSPSPSASPSASPAPSASPSASPAPSASPSTGGLVLSTSSLTVVRGSGLQLSGTVNGVAQTINVTVADLTIANATAPSTSVTINGLLAGNTTFTAVTAGGQNATGNISVVEGNLQSLLVVPANAATVDEGSITPFGCNATYSTTVGTVTGNVTTQVLWVVTPGATTSNNTGEIISFDNGAGNFTATRGTGGTVQVGAMLSTLSATAVQNTTVTINKVNPTVVVRPVGTTNTTSSKIPLGGWSRLYEAEAQYPSGFKKVLRGIDVTFTNTVNSRIGAVNQFNSGLNAGNQTGTCEVATSSAVHPNNGSFNLTAVYTNSASGTQSGSHTIDAVSYVLQGATASLALVPTGGRNILPGLGSNTTSVGYVRPLTVTATFQDKVAGSNFDMALFTNPNTAAATLARKAGAISIYLPPTLLGATDNVGNTRLRTDWGVKLYTAGITPIGYTHLLRNITSTFFNPATASPLNVRIQYKPSSLTTVTAVGPLNGTEIVPGSNAFGGISDSTRTAALNNFLLDGSTTMNLTLGSRNLARGVATNATLTAQYGIGGTEDVTMLSNFSNGGAGNVIVGDRTTGFGQVKGRVANAANASGVAQPVATINAKFPNNGFANSTVTVNSTGP